jgi:hypothetical protein
MSISFYSLDYIIEVNQKRLEEYNTFIQKVLERFTHIILIYSGLGIFLISLIQHVLDADIEGVFFYIFFITFSSLLILSLIYFFKLLLPAEIAYLDPPKRYYTKLKRKMDQEHPTKHKEIDDILKGSYIDELENAISANLEVFKKKSSFYYNALLFALLAIIPYTVCIGFHLLKKDNKIQKVEQIDRK